MSENAVQQLLESMWTAGLISAQELATLSQELSAADHATVQSICDRLVDDRTITRYQAERLLAGQCGECVVGGRYVILAQLGAGGMGAVYLARDRTLDRTVAVKVLPARSVSDSSAIQRFQREAKALAKLSHQNIVQAYDSGEDQGRHFLVMEHVEGTDLKRLLAAQPRIPPTVAADYIYQAALGLEHAHSRGLVHRDLKPSNLLLTPEGCVKILDLGLARFLQDQVGDATLTREGVGMGTPDYMAPEQFHDARNVDARSDIYSLGCTLYHLLTGGVPFPGSSLSDKFAAHESSQPTPVEDLCPGIPAGLAMVVTRMMAKRPADRFQTAREVAEALAPYVDGASASSRQIKAAANWQGSQLALSVARRGGGRLRRRLIGGLVAGVLTIGLAALWMAGVLRFESPSASGSPDQLTALPDGASKSPSNPQPAEPPDPNVLTVAQDGTGQFRSINEALAAVTRPNMTIRVLDAATYDEGVQIRDGSLYRGLTLEAKQRATIGVPTTGRFGLSVFNVAEVTVRGFRIKTNSGDAFCLGVAGSSPGVILDDVHCHPGQLSIGLTIELLPLGPSDPPLVVQKCRFNGCSIGIQALGMILANRDPAPIRNVVLRNNVLQNCGRAIWVVGEVNDVHVVANRVINSFDAGIRVGELLDNSGGILIANNTVQGHQRCLGIYGPIKTDGVVRICNNLLHSQRAPDIAVIGADSKALKAWKVSGNVRGGPRPTTPDATKEWLSADGGTPVDRIEFVSTDPQAKGFLRPSTAYPLDQAARSNDLPPYVGAVAPDDTPPWDWDSTWKAR